MGCGGANIAKASLTKAMNCTSFRSSLCACSACHSIRFFSSSMNPFCDSSCACRSTSTSSLLDFSILSILVIFLFFACGPAVPDCSLLLALDGPGCSPQSCCSSLCTVGVGLCCSSRRPKEPSCSSVCSPEGPGCSSVCSPEGPGCSSLCPSAPCFSSVPARSDVSSTWEGFTAALPPITR